MIRHAFTRRLAALALLVSPIAACGGAGANGDEHGHEEGEAETGPKGGRLLHEGDFELEIMISEAGAEPHFRVYAYRNDRPIAPGEVEVSVALTRLGGDVDRLSFAPEGDYLRSAGAVGEPHSFDVAVGARYAGTAYNWTYASYEGRTTISADQAAAAGVRAEAAGPQSIEEAVALSGRVVLQPQGRAAVSAWYPGRVVAMSREIGERVNRGDVLARVTSNESLQTYSIPSPISGVVMERNANVGDVSGEAPLYVIADASRIHGEFYAYPRDAERVRAGQPIIVRTLGGDREARVSIASVLPGADMATQTVAVYAPLPNGDGAWRPGQAVEAAAIVSAQQVPLAVRTRALQRLGRNTVVFVNAGDVYEARPLELGRQTPEWTEVLEGLEPGAIYVIDNAFLIRADIEKAGAGHEH